MAYPLPTNHGKYTNHAYASSSKNRLDSYLDNLPSLPTLISWSHRPQSIAKCFISDLYRMQVLVQKGMEGMVYASRDIFLLNQFPCKVVEIVAWVAGVDHKETTMTITVDDGDGEYILPVLVRLPIIPQSSSSSKSQPKAVIARTTFASSSERRSAKRKATEELLSAEFNNMHSSSKWSMGNTKVFERKDIRVGDTVRIVGKVDEWMRKKSDGSTEWVRQVVVDQNSGGSIAVVQPEDQYIHSAEVYNLHQTLYSKPFILPTITTIPALNLPTTPTKNGISFHQNDPSFSDSFGTTLTSEAPSELSMIDAEPELRDPTKLRSSQLTDRTFRQYMLDHMTQETIRSLLLASESDHSSLRQELEMYFPEYRQSNSIINSHNNNENKNKHSSSSYLSRKSLSSSSASGVFTPSTKVNSLTTPISKSLSMQDENTSTPTQKSFISRKYNRSTPTSSYPSYLKAFTPTSLLSNERLNTLAGLVVDSEARKEERRRRRRIRDGSATKKDLQVEQERKIIINGESSSYMPNEKERMKKMERLVSWAIRAISEEGSLVQVDLPCSDGFDRYGYLPLPSQLLLPLIIPHLIKERIFRKSTIRKKTDPKSINGMTIDELTVSFRGWGQDGRWERVGDWNLEDALEFGYQKGYLIRHGLGYWVADGYEEG